MRVNVAPQALLDRPCREATLDRARRKTPAMNADEHGGLGRHNERYAHRKPCLDGSARRSAHRHDAFLRAFAEHAHFAGRKIEPIDIEIRELGEPQTG